MFYLSFQSADVLLFLLLFFPQFIQSQNLLYSSIQLFLCVPQLFFNILYFGLQLFLCNFRLIFMFLIGTKYLFQLFKHIILSFLFLHQLSGRIPLRNAPSCNRNISRSIVQIAGSGVNQLMSDTPLRFLYFRNGSWILST